MILPALRGHSARSRAVPRPRHRRWVLPPWGRGDLLSLLFLILVSAAGLAGCWWGLSGTSDVAAQYRWLQGGVGAVVVGAVAYALWLLTGLRAIRRRREALILALTAIASSVDASARRGGSASTEILVLSAERMRRYHRAGCPLVQGREVAWATVDAQRRSGRQPCETCRP